MLPTQNEEDNLNINEKFKKNVVTDLKTFIDLLKSF